MFRWASNIFCSLSLLLSLILLIYGVLYANAARGVWLKRTDVVQFAGKEVSTPNIYYLNINDTELVFGHWRNPQVVEDSKAMHDGLLKLVQELRAYKVQSHQVSETLGMLHKRISDLQSENRARSWSVLDGFHVEYHDGVYSIPLRSVLSFGGVKYDSLPSWTPPATAFRCFLPIWYILPVLLIAPAARGFSIWRRIRRRCANVCPNCGYDLRASPDLCPECGNATN